MGVTVSRRTASASRSASERWATRTLLIVGGVASLLVAIRLAAAALSSSFSPFSYLPVPESHGGRVLLLLGAAIASAALLPFVLHREDAALRLEGERGGVLVGVAQIETVLRDQAMTHPEVAHAEVRLREHRGGAQATLDVALRPLVDGDAVAAQLAARARERLGLVTGLPEAQVRVRHRVLSVSQLAKVLS